MEQKNLSQAKPKVEADTHKYLLGVREKRKSLGKRKHTDKRKKDTKWFDHWE